MAGALSDGSLNNINANETEELVSQVELLRNLECPICSEIALPPIYQCNTGHSICNSCKGKLTNCGLCHAPFSDTRNYFQENIVNASKFKCRYHSDGCGEILKGEQQKAHATICKYRPIQCHKRMPGEKCDGFNKPLKGYLEHLRTVHNINGKVGKSFPVWFARDLNSDQSLSFYYMIFEGKEFLYHSIIKNGILTSWVSLIGQEEEAAKYSAKLWLYNKDDRRLQIEWTIPICSIRKSEKEIRESCLCAMLPVTAMQPFLKEETSETYRTEQKFWDTRCTITKLVNCNSSNKM